MPISNKPENIEKNPDRYTTCECGLFILKCNLPRHKRTAKNHQKWLETQKVQASANTHLCGDEDGEFACVATKLSDRHEKCQICVGFYDNGDTDDFIEVPTDARHPCDQCEKMPMNMIRWKHNGAYECQGDCDEDSDDVDSDDSDDETCECDPKEGESCSTCVCDDCCCMYGRDDCGLNCECHEEAPDFADRLHGEDDVLEALEQGEVKMMYRGRHLEMEKVKQAKGESHPNLVLI